MNYSQKLSERVGDSLFKEEVSIKDPLRAQNSARNVLKQSLGLLYLVFVLCGFVGAVSGGHFGGFRGWILLSAVCTPITAIAQSMLRESRKILIMLGKEKLLNFTVFDAIRCYTTLTTFMWAPIWALFYNISQEKVAPTWMMLIFFFTAASVIYFKAHVECRRNNESPNQFKWVEA